MAMCLFEQINYCPFAREYIISRSNSKKLFKLPNFKYAEDSKFKLDLIQDQLAGKEMYVARYYTKREKWGPALVRLNKL